MKNNPFAEVFKTAFYKDVLKEAVYTPALRQNKPPRVHLFMQELNAFLQTAGQSPIAYEYYTFDERKLLDYALFLRGYMRDAQHVLANLSQDFAIDQDIIKLFAAASEYAVACNHQLKDKRVFDNNVGYRLWKIVTNGCLSAAHYQKANGQIPSQKKNLFLFMPFRLKDDEKQVQKWLYANMRETLDNQKIFGTQVDMYVIHYPIQKSRSSNITSILQTIRENDSYFEPQDMDFVKQNWLDFLGKNIKINSENKVIQAQSCTPSELEQKFRHITIFSYCAGTANAHRCLNALKHLGEQIYTKETIQKAMQQIYVISYGFLPSQDHLPYSGVHLYSNALNDENRKEPFVNLNNHALYEKTKCTPSSAPARFSLMPDSRNYIVAFRLPERLAILKEHAIEKIVDDEYGHNLANINTPNLYDKDNFAHILFKTILENSSLGKRKSDVFKINRNTSETNQLTVTILQAKTQRI